MVKLMVSIRAILEVLHIVRQVNALCSLFYSLECIFTRVIRRLSEIWCEGALKWYTCTNRGQD